MTGSFFANWWTQMRPYLRLYQEVGPGVALVGYFYYKLSYGGKKAVKDKSHH